MMLLVVSSPLAATGAERLSAPEALAISREAYLYGLPLIENYSSLYEDVVDASGKGWKAPFNTLKQVAPALARTGSDVKTPDLDVARSYLWMDLRAEPLILGVPALPADRYYLIQLIDLYGFNIDYIGSHATGNGPGRYLVAGPGWEGEKPAGVTRVIRADTDFVLAIYRRQILGADDLGNVERDPGRVHR